MCVPCCWLDLWMAGPWTNESDGASRLRRGAGQFLFVCLYELELGTKMAVPWGVTANPRVIVVQIRIVFVFRGAWQLLISSRTAVRTGMPASWLVRCILSHTHLWLACRHIMATAPKEAVAYRYVPIPYGMKL